MFRALLFAMFSLSTACEPIMAAPIFVDQAGPETKSKAKTPVLIGGVEVDWEAWPFVAWMNKSCTATMLSAEVAVTAAHCMNNGQTVTLHYFDGQTAQGVCTHAPKKYDQALCKMNKSVILPRYASIGATDDYIQKKGYVVTDCGFGCINPDMTGGNDGKLRCGNAKISKPLVQSNGQLETKADVILCPGDSGGPIFAQIGNIETDAPIYVGTNVAVYTRRKQGKTYVTDTSIFTSPLSKKGMEHLTQWVAANNVKVCGFNQECPSGLVPPPPETCEADYAAAQASCKACTTDIKELAACQGTSAKKLKSHFLP